MAKILVVDSSVIVKWLNREDEQFLNKSDQIYQDGQSGKINIIAPELAKYEVGNALLNKGIDLPAAKISLSTIYSMPMNFFVSDLILAERTLEISLDTKVSFYDATFVALAERLHATLVTDNPKHQKKLSGVKVVSLGDYY